MAKHKHQGDPAAKKPQTGDPRTDPDVPEGMSIELLQDLHLLTRDRQLNHDARRKLKQIRHLVGLLKPALDDALARNQDPLIVDCGAGKSYLGALLYELVLKAAGRGRLTAIEARPELSASAAERAKRFGHERFSVITNAIAAADLPGRPSLVTALHACDTATDDALALGIAAGADHIAVVPCCQAEVARQLDDRRSASATSHDTQPGLAALNALYAHPLHRRELGSHLTNVIRGLVLEAHGYKVTVTELVGWEHSAKNELIIARRVNRFDNAARAKLRDTLSTFRVEPTLVRELADKQLDPRLDATAVSGPTTAAAATSAPPSSQPG